MHANTITTALSRVGLRRVKTQVNFDAGLMIEKETKTNGRQKEKKKTGEKG